MNKKLTWQKFIDFWKQFYDDRQHPDEKFYFPYINDLSEGDFLDKLWRWKMGLHFKNKSNQKVLNLIKENTETIRNFRKSEPTFNELYEFSEKIFKSGIVYRIFLVHICKPNDYPIFDQHVFRAFNFLVTGKITNMPTNIKDYLNYKKFVLKIHRQYDLNLRDIDRALMAFGQFLNNPKKFLKI
jgi:hypothetical protein